MARVDASRKDNLSHPENSKVESLMPLLFFSLITLAQKCIRSKRCTSGWSAQRLYSMIPVQISRTVYPDDLYPVRRAVHAFTAFSVLLCSFARIFTLSQENIYIYVALLQKFDRCIVVIPCSFLKKMFFPFILQ